ncbi:hypothetical protein B0J13DRAFT_592746 [Dactylonectria estremocensis]|uniref:Dockerin type 1 n=1 Tax=Dactylonectria estremocensis TaxID=1079267 RepID=A0A9P9FET4_9HYPO|nr:hypothetical protein B0J13DRAFT_592746 [Dactylonectria estremocensis]
MLSSPRITVLGLDPSQRSYILNGNTFQQDAIVSFAGWQYAVFYSPKPNDPGHKVLFIHLARRRLPGGDWEHIVFEDYKQTVDDGHNTVQMGICPGDGTIHLSYDHHCDNLKYKHSVKGLARKPEVFSWAADLFSATVDQLPGLPNADYHFEALTYPRFGNLGEDMFFSARNGQAGLGDDLLYVYRAATGSYEYVGKHLKGVKNNPYVHGMDYRSGKLHVTWVYRGFVYYEGWDDPPGTTHSQHAGPNGAENNYNICYAYSDDGGYTWKNGKEETIAHLREGESVAPDSPGIMAFDIPKRSGLMNQESQAVDHDGGVHVLNRRLVDGDIFWTRFYRAPSGQWTENTICPVPSNSRGCIAVSKQGDVYMVLPNPSTCSLRIYKSPSSSGFSRCSEVWVGVGYVGEPLVDRQRFEEEGVLSIFVIAMGKQPSTERSVVVLDFML